MSGLDLEATPRPNGDFDVTRGAERGKMEAGPFSQPELRQPLPSLNKQVGGDHYKALVIQPVEYAFANGLGFCEGNAVKYITRHRNKNGAEDLRKAIHYLELLLDLEYGEKP